MIRTQIFKHDQETNLGFCRDCAQTGGMGFKYWNEGDDPDTAYQFWSCCYCGSNHVTIKDQNGDVIWEGGDLYV